METIDYRRADFEERYGLKPEHRDGDSYVYVTSAMRWETWKAAIDAHLARQPEVSEQDVRTAGEAIRNVAAPYVSDFACAEFAERALTAVWHNRPALAALCERNPAPDASVPLVPTSATEVFVGQAQEKAEPVACRFCGHAGPFDRWPCEWLDGSGANVVRCPICHGAAPEATWNRPAERVRVPDGWKLVPVEPTQEMIDTALRVHGDEAFIAKAPALVSALVKIHKAMLSAAPEAGHG